MFIPNKNRTTVIDASGVMEDWPINQVPYRDADGTIKGTGLRILSRGTLLAPVGFAVESGSVDFGDVLRLSESAGFLAFENMIDSSKYQLLDYATPRNAPSSKPFYFKLDSAESRFTASTGSSKVITTNPLSFEYSTKLTARTNALIFNASQKMSNVRLRITDKKSGVAVKYFPSKSAWVDGSGGTLLDQGENVLDFQDTAVIFTANTDLIFDIQADNISLVGGDIPWFAGLVQKGSFVGVADVFDVSALQDQINKQSSGFNGDYSALTGVPKSFTPSAHTHVVADITDLPNQLTGLSNAISNKLDASSNIDIGKVSGLSQTLANKFDVSSVTQALSTKADASSISNVGKTGNYNDLTNKPVIPVNVSQLNNDFGYITASQVPQQSISWSSVTEKPSTFPPSPHQHAIADVSGLQAAINSKLDASGSISYNSLTDKPTIPTVNYPVTSVAGKTGAVILALADVSGLQASLAIKLDASSTISYNSLSNKPAIPSTVAQLTDASTYAKKTDINYPVNSVNNKTGNVILSVADVSGLSSLLTSKADASSLPVVRRSDNSLVARTKVKYYRVTSDGTSSIWTVNLGSDFTELLDVQITAESTGSLIGGIRQVSINTWTSTSATLSGMTFGSNTITTILVGGSTGLALAPATVVKVRVEGVGS